MLDQVEQLFMQQPLVGLGSILLVLGIVLLAIAGIVFRFRAITNHRAWGGSTVSFLLFGVISLLIGGGFFALGLHLGRI